MLISLWLYFYVDMRGGCEMWRWSDLQGGEGDERTLEYMKYECIICIVCLQK